jgi:hypothetical protein
MHPTSHISVYTIPLNNEEAYIKGHFAKPSDFLSAFFSLFIYDILQSTSHISCFLSK